MYGKSHVPLFGTTYSRGNVVCFLTSGKVEGHGERQLRFARFDRLLGDPDWKMVKELTNLDVDRMLNKYASKRRLNPHKSTHPHALQKGRTRHTLSGDHLKFPLSCLTNLKR